MSIKTSIAKFTNSGVSPILADIAFVLSVDGNVLLKLGFVHVCVEPRGCLDWDKFTSFDWCYLTKWILLYLSNDIAIQWMYILLRSFECGCEKCRLAQRLCMSDWSLWLIVLGHEECHW